MRHGMPDCWFIECGFVEFILKRALYLVVIGVTVITREITKTVILLDVAFAKISSLMLAPCGSRGCK